MTADIRLKLIQPSTIKLKLIQGPAVKCQVMPFFPGSVVAGAGISVTSIGGAFTIAWNPTTSSFTTFPFLATGATSTRSLADRFADVRNVKDFGAVGDGVANDAAAIQAAIDSLPASGGNVIFPAGIYKITSSLQIGNGNGSNTISSRGGVYLIGMGSSGGMVSPTFVGGPVPAVRIAWAGGASGMVNINGPLAGWGLQNIYLDGAFTATIGLFVNSGQYGYCQNLSVANCNNDQIRLTTVPTFGGFLCDCFHNTFINTNLSVPSVNFAAGLSVTAGGTNSNSDFNAFVNTAILGPGGAINWQGIVLGHSDGNVFVDTHIFGGSSAGIGVRLDYTTVGPANNYFFGIDAGTSGTTFSNNGSPPGGATANYVYGFSETNGAAVPVLPNLNVYAHGRVQFPATQIPSSDVNTLDDYEEGTWTPVLTFATAGNLAVVYSTQQGQYTKVGNVVTSWYSIATSTFTHTTASGNLQLTGLPFTVSTNQRSGAVRWQGITKANFTDVVGQAVGAATRIEFNISGSGQATTSVAFGDTPTGGTVILSGSVSYQV